MPEEKMQRPFPISRTVSVFFILFAAAFLIRVGYAVPGICDPNLLMRPDSYTYLAPASSLLRNGTYCGQNGLPTALRVPVYPLFLSLFLPLGSAFCVVMNCLISALAVPLVFLAAHYAGLKEKYAVTASLLLMISPTALALSPMFLSDGMFMTFTALQAVFFFRYIKQGGKMTDLLLCAAAAGAGTLTRPLNLLWIIFPVIAALTGKAGVPVRTGRAFAVLLLFGVIVFPWICRNYRIGAGWRLDAVSADSLKHNAASVMIRLTGRNGEEIRNGYDAYFAGEFAAHPERYPSEDARLSFQEKTLVRVLREHPFLYLRGFFHPVNFVPDIPNFTGNLGLGNNGIGTWDVIQSEGFFAGGVHYFRNNLPSLILLVPLSLVLLFTYLAGAFRILCAIRRKEWNMLFFFAAFCLYYYAVTGPVAYPRFSLPGLPAMCILAASGLELFRGKRKNVKAD